MGTSLIVSTGDVSCYPALPCFDGEKSGSLMTNFGSFTVAVTKNLQSNRIYVSVGTVGLSHVRARYCTSTPSLQNGCVFGLWDAWFHVPMLLSADTPFLWNTMYNI